MSGHVWTIAAHEYWTNVRRKEFIAMTLGLPLLMLALGGISALGTISTVGKALRSGPRFVVGVIDRSHELDLDRAAPGHGSGPVVVPYSDLAQGQADVKAGRIRALVVVDASYLQTGKVEVYRKGGGILTQGEGIPIGPILTRALLAHGGVDSRLVERAVQAAGPGGPEVFTLQESGRFAQRDMAREAMRFAVPYGFTIFFITAIFIASNYLLRGIADEKENRVIEVILSTVTAEELLRGKLIGLAGVGLTQVLVWLLMAAIPASIFFAAAIQIRPTAVLGALLFFALGFGLYATLMAGLGALGTSYRESQQTAGIASMGAFFPLALLPVLLEYPNGTLARVFSLIPFTAPTTMVLRMTAATVPVLDVVLSAAVLILATWLVLKLSAKLFRYGLLIYGKRPTFRETLRWLRQA